MTSHATPSAEPITEHSLSLRQRILLSTDGTVTDLIALYTGEAIRVTKVEQQIETAIAPAMLACAEPTRLLNRKILLSGASANYLYAESIFVFERLSPAIQEQLLATDRPIGLLWKEARLETFREIIEQQIERCGDIAHHFRMSPDALLVARTYLIHHAGRPLGAITEKWPLAYFRD